MSLSLLEFINMGIVVGVRFLLSDMRNSFDFFVRERFSFSRRSYTESGFDLNHELATFAAGDAHLTEALIDKYRLSPYLDHLGRLSFLDNLVHLMLLDSLSRYMQPFYDGKVLDVGSKNFAYCVALYEFLRGVCRDKGGSREEPIFQLFGVELDVHRRYSNLYTRKACADYYTRLIPRGKYIAGDILKAEFQGPFHLLTHFYPFIHVNSLLDFGLPSRFFKPLETFRRVFQLLQPGGQYILANTTRDEYLHSRSLLEACQFIHMGSSSVCNGLTNHKPIYASVYYK